MNRAVIAALSVAALAVTVAACDSSPARSPQAFCSTYAAEKAKYLQNTDVGPDASGAQLLAGLGSVLGLPDMFDRLDKVAPNDIEPDVAKIRDALQKSEDSANGQLSGLAGGLVAGLESGPSWQRVGDYITANCSA